MLLDSRLRNAVLTGRRSQRVPLAIGPSRVGFLTAYRFQNLSQRQNLLLRNEKALFAVGLCFMPETTRLMKQRLLSHIEFKPKAGNARLRPSPQSLKADPCSDHLRGLAHIVKALAGLLINVGRGLLHPGRLPESPNKITKKVRKGKAFVDPLPGSVPFLPSLLPLGTWDNENDFRSDSTGFF